MMIYGQWNEMVVIALATRWWTVLHKIHCLKSTNIIIFFLLSSPLSLSRLPIQRSMQNIIKKFS